MSIYHKIPDSSLDVNGTHVLEAFLLENYWKYVSPLYCSETSAVKHVFHSWDWTRVHQFSILNWEREKCNSSQMEHFLHVIDISLLKCFSAVTENAHNLAITWFRWLN